MRFMGLRTRNVVQRGPRFKGETGIRPARYASIPSMPDLAQVLPAALPALRRARGHDLLVAALAALLTPLPLSLPGEPLRSMLAGVCAALALLFGLRGLLQRVRRALLVEATVERKELSPVARPGGEPLRQLVVRVRGRYRFDARGRWKSLPVDDARLLVDVAPALYDAIPRWQPILLLYAPGGELLGAFTDGYRFVEERPAPVGLRA